MEDSGYYSHKSGEFKLFSSASSESSYRRRLFSQELLTLTYQQFQNSEKFKHLVSGFRDEQDFEEFKADLRDFWKLRESTCEEAAKSPTPEHMLMEFFNSDENFKEFERVFDDFKCHRFYDFDDLKKRRSRGDPLLSEDGRRNSQAGHARDHGEAFSEFFDNDEDFKQFEEEFANFKVKQRRSRALDDFNRRSWCDLRSDINAGPEGRKGQTSTANNRHSFSKDGGLNDASGNCQADRRPENVPPKPRLPRDRQFKRQSTSDESEYFTCREFPDSPAASPRAQESGKTFPYGTPPAHDPPSYEFVMKNRKCPPAYKSHSCDYDDLRPEDPTSRDWNPRSHVRSQSYDFSRKPDHYFPERNGIRTSPEFRNRGSKFSKRHDVNFSGANPKFATDSQNSSRDSFAETEEDFRRNDHKTTTNSCNRSQSYDFSEKLSNSNKKFDSKSHSFDYANDSCYKENGSDTKSHFSRSLSREFSENVTEEIIKNKEKSRVHSSTSSNDTNYQYSAKDQKCNESSRSTSSDFSESSSKNSKGSNSETRRQKFENSQREANDSKSSAKTTSKSQSMDFSQKVSNNGKSSKINTKSSTSNLAEESAYDVNGLGQGSKSAKRSQSYDFSEVGEKFKDKKCGSNLNRYSYSEKAHNENRTFVDPHGQNSGNVSDNTTSTCDKMSDKSRLSDSYCDAADRQSDSRARYSLDEAELNESDFYDCSEDDVSTAEDLYREIYHGGTDFTQLVRRKYPGARRLVSNLPTVYSRHSSDSELDMGGGTYPNIRLDRAPVSEGLKRRSADYYDLGDSEDTLGDYHPYVRVCRDYGQRKSHSDNSIYIPRPTHHYHGNHRDPHKQPTDCQYTCHHRCRPLVTLDCTTVTGGDESATTDGETALSSDGRGSCQSCAAESDTSPLLMRGSSQSDDTDSGYRSGGIQGCHRSNSRSRIKHDPDSEKREELRALIDKHNEQSPSSLFCFIGDSLSFQGFIRVTLNLIRPITMSLGARPPSIYEVLTREHIVEQNTMSISFYMPRDTIKQIHVTSEDTTKEVVAALLKKFKILDNPRKFALYAQELNNGKIEKLWRVGDKDFPIKVCLNWGCEDLKRHRLVLQENETGEIEWNAFSRPELENFMRILDKEESECIAQLEYKYKVMKRIIQQRMKEIRKERKEQGQRS